MPNIRGTLKDPNIYKIKPHPNKPTREELKRKIFTKCK